MANAWRMAPESVVLHSGRDRVQRRDGDDVPGVHERVRPTCCSARSTPEAFIATVERERVTHTMLVPAQIIAILSLDGFDPTRLTSLECLLSLGAPLLVEHKERLTALLPDRFYELYGLTEGFVTILDRDDAQRKAGSVGVPPPFYEMRIVGEDGRDLPPGDVGEIVGRGPITMPGYYGAPGADGGGAARRLALHRRPGLRRRRRLPVPRRSQEGHDRLGRRQGLPEGRRGGRRAASRRARGRGVRHPARAMGRDAGGRGGADRAGAGTAADARASGSTRASPRATSASTACSSWRTFRATPRARPSSARCARRSGRARPEDLAQVLARIDRAPRIAQGRVVLAQVDALRRAARAPRHGRAARGRPAPRARSRASGRSLRRDSRRASRCPTSAAAGRSSPSSVSITGTQLGEAVASGAASVTRPESLQGPGDASRPRPGRRGQRPDLALANARLRAVVDHDVQRRVALEHAREPRQVPRQHQRIEHEVVGDHRLEHRRVSAGARASRRRRCPAPSGAGRRAAGPREARDRVGRVPRVEVDPADDARDERRRARERRAGTRSRRRVGAACTRMVRAMPCRARIGARSAGRSRGGSARAPA